MSECKTWLQEKGGGEIIIENRELWALTARLWVIRATMTPCNTSAMSCLSLKSWYQASAYYIYYAISSCFVPVAKTPLQTSPVVFSAIKHLPTMAQEHTFHRTKHLFSTFKLSSSVILSLPWQATHSLWKVSERDNRCFTNLSFNNLHNWRS